MTRHFGGVIWTDHAIQRLRERGITQQEALLAFTNADQTRYAKRKSAWVYYKQFGRQKIEVVAKKNERGEWLILSVWKKTGQYTSPRGHWLWRLLKQILWGDYR